MKINTRKFWYKFFLILGLLSIIDIATGVINGTGSGYISLVLFLLLVPLLGTNSFFLGMMVMILDLALIWLLLAWLLKPKRAKIITESL